MSHRRPESPLPYSTVCDLNGDAEQLGPYLSAVDAHPEALQGQHAIRRWEYAMALYAIDAWNAAQHDQRAPFQICDVGGAGSNFWQVLAGVTSEDIIVVDDRLESLPAGQVLGVRGTVEEAAEGVSPLVGPGRFDLLTCISVIEHVDEVRKFCRACHTLLKPGGLFFLTMDYWDAEGPDTAHYHWMRTRIYNRDRVTRLREECRTLGFRRMGQADWAYHGPQLYDYSICSLALLKRDP